MMNQGGGGKYLGGKPAYFNTCCWWYWHTCNGLPRRWKQSLSGRPSSFNGYDRRYQHLGVEMV